LTLSPGSHATLEKQQVGACCFSKEFNANPRNASTNRKKRIALCCFKKIVEKIMQFLMSSG
jgi:hypothetical protein